ncbi:MAG: 3-phosphoshikimate 1-carboxyvinyltransferase [Frankiaceae bacterium]
MDEVEVWQAPTAASPVDAVVSVPGSKSDTNRSLVLAALAEGTSRLRGPLRARDTLLMAAGLRALGVAVDEVPRADGADWRVTGTGGTARLGHEVRVDCGNAGTVARFLPPVAALASADVVFDGDPRLRERPLGPLVEALRGLGVAVTGTSVPLVVHGRGAVRGGSVRLDASSSSQFVSGLLLAAPCYDEGVCVIHDGPPIPSRPHLAMTVGALRRAGAVVDDRTDGVWAVAPGALTAIDRNIEPDLSTASAFLAAAAASAGQVVLRDWPEATEQPGAMLPHLLEDMGCVCARTPAGLSVRGPQRLAGIDVDLHDYGEAVPTLTALATLADGRSRLRGVGHLRFQETDRLAALAQQLGRLGARITVTADGLVVDPAPLHGGTLDPQADHRLAMAFAVVGLVVPGVVIHDIATTGKTVPEFPRRWLQMVAGGR